MTRRARQAFTLIELLVVISIGATLIAVVAPAAVRRFERGSATAAARSLGQVLERAARRVTVTGRALVVDVDPRNGRITVLEERADAKAYGVTQAVNEAAFQVDLPEGFRVSLVDPGGAARARLEAGGSARRIAYDVSGPAGRARVVLDPVAARARVEAK